MEYKDLSKKSVNELNKILSEERGKLYDLNLKMSINQLKDVRSIRSTRRNIAKLLTAIQTNNTKEVEEVAK